MNSGAAGSARSGIEWSEHVGLGVGLVAVVLIALRLLAAGGFSVNTSSAILVEGGSTNVLAAAALFIIPVLLIASATVVVGFTIAERLRGSWPDPRFMAAAAVALVLGWRLAPGVSSSRWCQ